MNLEIKTKWLKALRSGIYKQVTGELHSEKGYCCLEVLCDVFDPTNSYDWKGQTLLPDQLTTDVGLSLSNPLVTTTLGEVTLAYLNDHRAFTFTEIADIVEEQL